MFSRFFGLMVSLIFLSTTVESLKKCVDTNLGHKSTMARMLDSAYDLDMQRGRSKTSRSTNKSAMHIDAHFSPEKPRIPSGKTHQGGAL